MKNFVQTGKVLTLAAPYNRLSGQGAQVGSIFGVAAVDVLSTVEAEFAVEGVFELVKAGSQAWSVGDRIYWDNSAKVCTKTVSTNLLVGVAVEAVASGAGDTLGKVKLIPLGDSDPGNLAQAAAVADLNQDISNSYTEAEIQAISDKVDELLAALRTAGLLASS
jgi:predicted RecA/RadA family phage recombinase